MSALMMHSAVAVAVWVTANPWRSGIRQSEFSWWKDTFESRLRTWKMIDLSRLRPNFDNNFGRAAISAPVTWKGPTIAKCMGIHITILYQNFRIELTSLAPNQRGVEVSCE